MLKFADPLLVTGTPDNPEVTGLRRISLRRDAQADTAALFDENWLQTIIDRSPQVLPVDEFYEHAARLWSLGREIPVRLAESVRYIDNLLVTDEGHLVLVETKLARNPEAIRDVVAQVLQYAMAIGNLSLAELEQACRDPAPQLRRLQDGETIAMRVRRASSKGEAVEAVADDFEDRLATLRQAGEMLVLIVADGIQTSAERLVEWISSKFRETSPLKFGLVELRVFDSQAGKIVVPKTLLRTREISRHTIVVKLPRDISATVLDEEAGHPPASRSVRKPDTVLTKEALLEQVRAANPPETYDTVTAILAGLDGLGLDTKGTPTMWLYGLSDGSAFHTLAAFSSRYLWCQIPARLRAQLGDTRFVDCKRALNRVATFYRPEDVEDPAKVNALTPRYEAVVGKASEFVDAIRTVASLAQEAIAGR